MFWALSLQNIQNDKETEWGLDIERPFGFPARTEQPDIDQNVHLKFYYVFFMCFFSVELLLPMFWISWWRFWKPNCKDSSEVFTWEFVGIEGPSKDRSSFCKLSIIVYIFLSSDIFRIMPLESVWPGLRHPPVSQCFTCMHHLLRCHDPVAQYSSHLWL